MKIKYSAANITMVYLCLHTIVCEVIVPGVDPGPGKGRSTNREVVGGQILLLVAAFLKQEIIHLLVVYLLPFWPFCDIFKAV